jgi:hypothetical protein
MSADVIQLIAGIVQGTLDKGQSVLLHELLWSVDAQLHLVATPEEINEALQQVTPVQIKRRGGHVELAPGPGKARAKVTGADVDRAFAIYHDEASETIEKLIRKARK